MAAPTEATPHPVGVSHADLLAQHAKALVLLDQAHDVALSKAEGVVSKLKVTQPREREACVTAHRAELEARRTGLARRWIPKLASALAAWRKAPSRDTTSPVSVAVRDYITEAESTLGAAEPLLLGISFAETMIASSPASIVVWSNPGAWREHGGHDGENTLSNLTRKAFMALANPLDIGAASRALEAWEAQAVALLSDLTLSWGSNLDQATADWESFKTGESLLAIVERFDAQARMRLQIAAQAAETDARIALITRARGGDAAARYQLGKDGWASAQRLDSGLYGPLVA